MVFGRNGSCVRVKGRLKQAKLEHTSGLDVVFDDGLQGAGTIREVAGSEYISF